jgi:23S rRNA pseudouridine2457 synthase
MKATHNKFRYFIFYKPFHTLSSFTTADQKRTLSDFFKGVSKDIYPIGRLDYDSEGLLLLTNDTSLNHQLLQPVFSHQREYWVQVEGLPDAYFFEKMKQGVAINVNGKMYKTRSANAALFNPSEDIPERNPPIRFRKHIPTTWISLTLSEGKNRQVRKMTAAAGFPTLRLIRWRIEKITLAQMKPGDILECPEMPSLLGLQQTR